MVHEEHMENLRELLDDMVQRGAVADAVTMLLNRHPADQADILEWMEEATLQAIARQLEPGQLADILEYLDDEDRARILAELPAVAIASALDEVDEDEAADIVQDLPPEQQQQVVPLLEDREAVEELLTYPEQSAGGRMSTETVSLHEDWSVQQSIDFLRDQKPEEDHPFYLYAVDDEDRLLGVVSLRSLITAAPGAHIAGIMSDGVISVRTDEDQEVVAERMRHYNLLALPVVDQQDRLRGVITADDVLDVQVEEATEDMFKMAGVGVEEWAFSPVLESARRRIPWLSFNMVWAFAGASAISLFEGTIEKVAALAIFMPMIAGQAGNAGIQTSTIVVRSLALGEIQVSDAFRLLQKEWAVGIIKGIIFGFVLGCIAVVWKGSAMLGVVAGVSLCINIMLASTTGVLLPMTLRRFGIDPATLAGVFDTMLTDLMGFVIYLGLATLLISYLT